jgi:hypothetical protein
MENESKGVISEVFKRGLASVPHAVWSFCGAYAAIVFTTTLSLVMVMFFSGFNIGVFATKYADIWLDERREHGEQIDQQQIIINELIQRNNRQDEIIRELQRK